MDNLKIVENQTLNELVSQINNIHKTIQSDAIKSISSGLTLRNWIIGYYIVEYEQNGIDIANYGDKIVENIAFKLSHIKGMSKTNIKLYRQFYLQYKQIGQAVTDQLSIKILKSQAVTDQSLEVPIDKLLRTFTFTHFVELIKLDDDLKRVFYEVEAIKGSWSVRELKRQINSQIFERVGLSKNKKELIQSLDKTTEVFLPQQIIKDPYILEFTGLEKKVKYSENDLESSLLNHIQDFLLELGNGFCFEARQKRISIDNEHDRVDLVFYHRILKCHILIDLKIREFSHADVGQMNFYINYYKNEISESTDNPPIGLILCANKNNTKVEYATAGLDNNLFVSKYKINLPSVEEIEEFIEDELESLEGEI